MFFQSTLFHFISLHLYKCHIFGLFLSCVLQHSANLMCRLLLQEPSIGVLSVLTPLVISHLTGVALYTLPTYFQKVAMEHFPVSETEAVVLTAIAIYTAGHALPHSTNRYLQQFGDSFGRPAFLL